VFFQWETLGKITWLLFVNTYIVCCRISVRIFIKWVYAHMRVAPEWFRHPGEETFKECKSKFQTSNLGFGNLLFYVKEDWSTWLINHFSNVDSAEKELMKICTVCPKYEWCLVNEVLLNTLAYVDDKIQKRNIKVST